MDNVQRAVGVCSYSGYAVFLAYLDDAHILADIAYPFMVKIYYFFRGRPSFRMLLSRKQNRQTQTSMIKYRLILMVFEELIAVKLITSAYEN